MEQIDSKLLAESLAWCVAVNVIIRSHVLLKKKTREFLLKRLCVVLANAYIRQRKYLSKREMPTE